MKSFLFPDDDFETLAFLFGQSCLCFCLAIYFMVNPIFCNAIIKIV